MATRTLKVVITGNATGAEAAMSRLSATGAKLSSIGTKLTRTVTLPLVGAGVASVALAADFDSSMSKITGLVGISASKVDKMRESVLNLAGETAQSPRKLADALFFITSAGLRGATAMDALEASAKASSAGLGEVTVIADAVTSAMNAYEAQGLTASQATDVLTAAVREGKLEAASLAPVLGRLLPTASAMGIGFDQVAGVLAVFSRTGADAAQGATSLQAIMTTLVKPAAESTKALEGVGLKMSDLREQAKGPGGLISVMRTLETAFAGNDEELAKVVPNVEAFRGVMNVLAQSGKTVDDVMAGVAQSTGASGEAFDVASKTSAFKFKQALADLEVGAVRLGQKLLPVAEKIVGVVSGLADAFTSLPDWAQTFIIGGAAVAAAVGPFLRIGGAVASLAGALPSMSGGMLSFAGLLAPLGAVALPLAVLGFGALLNTFVKGKNIAEQTNSEFERMDAVTQLLGASTRRATESDRAWAEAKRRIKEETQSATDALNKFRDAQLQGESAQLGLEAAGRSYAETLFLMGDEALETRQAALQFQLAIDDQIITMQKSKKGVDEQIAVLQFLAGTVAPGSSLQKFIQTYINKLNAIPGAKGTHVFTNDLSSLIIMIDNYKAKLDSLPRSVATQVSTAVAGGIGGVPHMQTGGPIPGPRGAPFPVVAHGGEYVLSADVVDRIKRGDISEGSSMGRGVGRGGERPIVMNFNVPPGADQSALGRTVVNAILEYERTNGSDWRRR